MNIDQVIETDPPNRQPSEKLKELMTEFRENEKNLQSNLNHIYFLSTLKDWWRLKTKHQKYLFTMIKLQTAKRKNLLDLIAKELENDILNTVIPDLKYEYPK